MNRPEVLIDGIVFSLQRHGGITVYFRTLIEALAGSEFATTVTLEAPLRQDAVDEGPTTRIHMRPARHFERWRPARIDGDVALFHSSYYRLPADRRIPTVVTVHDFVYERFASGPRRLAHSLQKNRAIAAADAIVCISEATKRDLLDFVGVQPHQSIHVVYNGVGEVFRPLGLDQRPTERRYVLFVGQRGGYKNFHLLTEALAGQTDWDVVCVGGGPFDERELAHLTAPARSRLRHAGHVDDETLNALYNRALCLVYPSAWEGFGIPVVEAMRAGCPVVCISCPAVLEVGGDALVVSEPDSHALARAIARTGDPAERQLCRARGFAIASRFSWAATHAATLDVYRRTIEHHVDVSDRRG